MIRKVNQDCRNERVGDGKQGRAVQKPLIATQSWVSGPSALSEEPGGTSSAYARACIHDPSHNRDGLPLGVLKLLYLGVAAREGLQAAPGQQSPERLRSCLMWEADNACGTVCHCPGIS